MNKKPHLVLVGGGHSHVQVLRAHLMNPLNAHITVIVDRPEALYSGMVPGMLSGQYKAHELIIDVHALARKAGIAVVHGAATGVDLVNQQVQIAGRPPLSYDLVSVNVGSVVASIELPGVKEFCTPTRPIYRLCQEFDQWMEDPPSEVSVVVVGAGAGGVELAATVHQRLKTAGVKVNTTLVGTGERPMVERVAALGEHLIKSLKKRNISYVRGRVASVHSDHVLLESGEKLFATKVFWVAGAYGASWLKDSFKTEKRGFILVEDTLQIQGFSNAFAVGDCAVPRGFPDIPKAGVYAVREGPVLIDNLRRSLAGEALVDYAAQSDFLTLLNMGDGIAVGCKWRAVVEGRAMMIWKDQIDRAFMKKFQVVGPGSQAEDFASTLPPMEQMEMVCGGCASKVGASELSKALSRLPLAAEDSSVVLGTAAGDDVAVWRDGDAHKMANVDGFTAFIDDPYFVGLVAARNATSDLWVSGGRPRYAMAMVSVRRDRDESESLFQVMAGVRAALDDDGVTLVGGHSTLGEVVTVHLAVWGDAPTVWAKSGAKPGDVLVLSGGLGTGVLFAADGEGAVAGDHVVSAYQQMKQGNRRAVLALEDPHAVTDVTGFGLAGHLVEMMQSSGCSAELNISALPVLDGVVELIQAGVRSTFHQSNVDSFLKVVSLQSKAPKGVLLFDPQTSGPVLAAVAPDEAEELLKRWRELGLNASVVGRVVEREEALITCR